jgi:DNA recombination protein RmuC
MRPQCRHDRTAYWRIWCCKPGGRAGACARGDESEYKRRMLDPVLVVVIALVAAAAAASGMFVVMLRWRPEPERDAAGERIADLAKAQTESVGRLEAMIGMLATGQSQLQHVVNERLDSVSLRVGQSLETTKQQTVEGLQKLNERLAVIDSAQKNLTDLTSQVTSLRDVLSNKQARGAFGQGRMEVIVRDGLPKSCYEFQFTLSNRMRPDCAVFLHDDRRPLVIDAKFPLEAVTAFREAKSEDERSKAAQRLRQDVAKHVADIAEKYLIPGETQELALMFVPAESVYAELHEGFDDIVQKAYRARVVLVSPSLLMLAIQVMQQIQRDAKMREAAESIRTEVDLMTDDLGRLRERVLKLQQHFGQLNEDVRQILISADKIDKRAGRIKELEFDGEETPSPSVIPAPMPRRLEAGE